jgi:phosphate transport system permease protein
MAHVTQMGARPRPHFVLTDRAFNGLLALAASAILALVALIGFSLANGAAPALKQFGWHFVTGRDWDPVQQNFGALPFIWGTLASSLLALTIAVPIGLGTAIVLAELAPRWMAQPLSFMVELLAAVPSVVYGLWAIFVLVPIVRAVQMRIGEHWGNFPLFSGPPIGLGLLTAAIVLAIMILPFITSISRDALQAVPRTQADAALALGATRWEAIRGPVLGYARKGILGGIILALGRALGETMAVTMVIGNVPSISASLFEPAYSMSAVLANQFAEATEPLHLSALVAVAFLLLVLTIIVNALARLLIWGAAGRAEGAVG